MKESDKLFSPVHVVEVMEQMKVLGEFLESGVMKNSELYKHIGISRQTFSRRLQKKDFTVVEMYKIIHFIDSKLYGK